LLQLDDVRILLDCGWTDACDEGALADLATVAPTIDVVLISNSTLHSSGALVHAVAKLGLRAPIYMTQPTFTMAQMAAYDLYTAKSAVGDFDAYTLDDVDALFDSSNVARAVVGASSAAVGASTAAKITTLKFSQHVTLAGKGAGITITPYAAGHVVGGAIFKIAVETEEVVYAMDYNHRKERHLDGTILESLVRPTLLITGARNALRRLPPRRERDSQFISALIGAMRNGGNALVPCDTAGRVLELLLMVEQHWAHHQLSHYTVAFYNNVAPNVLEFAKSQLEWMSDAVVRMLENSRQNPFDFRYIRAVHSRRALDELPRPLIVFTSLDSLDVGPARQLFVDWAGQPNNVIVFPSTPAEGTLAARVAAGESSLVLPMATRVPLTGEELLDYHRRRQQAAEDAEMGDEGDDELGGERERGREGDVEMGGGEEGGGGGGGEGGGDGDDMMDADFRSPFLVANKLDVKRTDFATAPPIFPFVHATASMDSYGEPLDIAAIVERAAAAASPTTSSLAHPSLSSSSSLPGTAKLTDLRDTAEPSVPTRVETREAAVTVAASVHVIDFDGRSDGRSIKTILSHVAPRKLILVQGAPEEIAHLAEHAATTLRSVTKAVLTPGILESLDVTSDTNVYRVKLRDALLASLSFSPAGEYELAPVRGTLVDGGVGGDAILTLPSLPPSLSGSSPVAHVGDPKLPDLRRLLLSKGHRVELRGGVLMVDGVVTVRKSIGDDGQVLLGVEGVLGEMYYRIRDEVLSVFSVVKF
jgi:cleavage and polyadenylation specificity factor subunit 2